MKKRIVLIITLFLAIAIAVSVAVILIGSNSNGPISMEDIEKIEVGMTQEEVWRILGYDGRETGAGRDIREWDIENGKFLLIVFTKDLSDYGTEGFNPADCPIIVEEVRIVDVSLSQQINPNGVHIPATDY